MKLSRHTDILAYLAKKCWVSSLFIITLLSSPLTTIGQSCLSEGKTFSSQAEIDAFFIDFPNCTELDGPITIEESSPGNIINLNGFRRIKKFTSQLEIHGNEQLKDLSGLENVTYIEGLNIYYNRSLLNVKGLESLDSIKGSLRLSNLASINSISALANLRDISGDLSISSNERLDNLKGLANVRAVGGYLILSENDKMQNLFGLNGLQSTGRGILIQDNLKLQELSGLDNLIRVGGNLILENNDGLMSAQGINKLQIVNGNLLIVNNRQLFDINAFLQLKSINGLLQIFNNPELISLSGLDNINPNGIEDLAILSDRRLFECQVTSICAYLLDEKNQAAILRNADGCASREQVLASCSKGEGNNQGLSSKFTFFPNPTFDHVMVKGPGAATADLRIMTKVGHILENRTLDTDQISLEKYPAGMYILELQTKTRLVRSRVIRL